MAPPVEIAVEASNGASDYGNKFGEPVLAGFARSFGMMLPNGERREWVKPIMFSGGIGMIDGEGVSKLQPEKGEFFRNFSAIIFYSKVKGKGSLHTSQVAHQAGAYPGFCSMKRLGVFLLPPGWDASPSQGHPQH